MCQRDPGRVNDFFSRKVFHRINVRAPRDADPKFFLIVSRTGNLSEGDRARSDIPDFRHSASSACALSLVFPGCMLSCRKGRAGRQPAATQISEAKEIDIVWPGVADPRAAEGRRAAR